MSRLPEGLWERRRQGDFGDVSVFLFERKGR
jgi:hypothetical protein